MHDPERCYKEFFDLVMKLATGELSPGEKDRLKKAWHECRKLKEPSTWLAPRYMPLATLKKYQKLYEAVQTIKSEDDAVKRDANIGRTLDPLDMPWARRSGHYNA